MPPSDVSEEKADEAVTPRDVERLAAAARLALTGEEAERHAADLNRFLDYARPHLDGVDTDGVEPLAPGAPAAPQHLRPDKPARPLSQADALEDAPESKDGLFRLPGAPEAEE